MVLTEQTNSPSDDLATLHQSPWTLGQRVRRGVWYGVQATVFRFSPRTAWGWRRFCLRLFGAKLHRQVRIRSTARIEIPWNLTADEHTSIGEFAIIYNLGPITLGKRVTISQYAHLCAGTHDFDKPTMPLLRPPIVVGDDAWIAADAFVGPGVTVGEGAVVGARASAFKDVPEWMIVGGNPAKPIRPRTKPGTADDADQPDTPSSRDV